MMGRPWQQQKMPVWGHLLLLLTCKGFAAGAWTETCWVVAGRLGPQISCQLLAHQDKALHGLPSSHPG
eukprot:CAMPEP_0202387812 /NCGR_PEP_ID=MMETSP1127-20130417/74047_1 /ASSEMBLY_ACC=CAM_ASM_000462 /TAXON_ID=3047 /ORGANISM="Dunaliella tertiolecta, Strain CCMP1320" /LENGTH=67 /DNA_ID=CAMNT_0048988973 /DNA_START=109 /DNA_END=312 /DNA_ORIENTATION=-